jgi:hypothetical protein
MEMLVSGRPDGRPRVLGRFPAPCFPCLLVLRAHVGPCDGDVIPYLPSGSR